MIGVPEALARVELVLALIALLSVAKSAYNGLARELVSNIRRIPNIEEQAGEIEEQQEKIRSRQGDMADALVAVSYSQQYDDVEVPPDRMREELQEVEDGPSRFTDSGDSFVRGGRETGDD